MRHAPTAHRGAEVFVRAAVDADNDDGTSRDPVVATVDGELSRGVQ